jgi:tetratricopeptide (TPR) repeat protein
LWRCQKHAEKYQGTLEDLDNVDVFEPNNAFTLRSHGKVKHMLDDHQGALDNFDKADVLDPNNAFTLNYNFGVSL